MKATSAVSVEFPTKAVVLHARCQGMAAHSVSILFSLTRLLVHLCDPRSKFGANVATSSTCIVYSNGSEQPRPNSNVQWTAGLGVRYIFQLFHHTTTFPDAS